MPISVSILCGEDRLQATDWVRPLAAAGGEFIGSEPPINSFSTYGGSPQNHFKWVQAADVIGECWMGKTLAELDVAFGKFGGFGYEVARGDIPKSHIWDWRKAKRD